MQPVPARSLQDLDPSEFENLAYDLLVQSGVRNVVWRTPGADGGRDMEGDVFTRDFSGQDRSERWYIECKRYEKSLDWPLVYGKVAFADTHGADFLLVVTNSNPSPACETNISTWNNAKRKPLIRFWRGYEIEGLLAQFPLTAVKYGLASPPASTQVDFLSLSSEISKITQAAYASFVFNKPGISALETSSALSELLSIRLVQLSKYGRFVPLYGSPKPSLYPWVTSIGDVVINDVVLRACLTSVRFVTDASTATLRLNGESATIDLENCRLPLSTSGTGLLRVVGIWSNVTLTIASETQVIFASQK